MAITAQMVKELRESTGAGMMDCKKALQEAEGNMERAVDILREKGLSKAAKKADRIAAEGLVAIEINEDNTVASMVEVNSETDFVAKNEKFQAYVAQVAEQALETEAAVFLQSSLSLRMRLLHRSDVFLLLYWILSEAPADIVPAAHFLPEALSELHNAVWRALLWEP